MKIKYNMKNIKVIILAGTKTVGKDTFYNILSNNDIGGQYYRGFSFAEPIKDDLQPLCKKMFNKDIYNLTPEEKEIFRPIMIAYGCAWRAIDPEHWIKEVARKVEFANHEGYVGVVRDGRFTNELEFFKNQYGKSCLVVEISREDNPEPTEEEKKNHPLLQKYIDYRVRWPFLADKNLESLSTYVRKFLDAYNL